MQLSWIGGAIVALYAGLLAGSAPAFALDQVHDCDEYAAHPDDPNRWAKGVADNDIIPGPAVKFCADAATEYPDTPRFLFQLGRALWAARLFEDGTEAFLFLEENFDYDPVYAYLGDAFFYGIGGVEVDEALALSLYEVAADSGFGAAEEALAGLTGTPAAELPATEETQFAAMPQPQSALQPQPVIAAPAKLDASSFSQPKAIRALERGDLDGLKTAGLGDAEVLGMRYSKLMVYLAGFNSQFSGSYNFKDPTCIALYNPRIGKRLERDMAQKMTRGGTTMGAAEATLGMLLGTMQQMQSGSMMGMVDQSQAIEIIREEGIKDGAKLILGYTCQSPVTQRIYANLAAHVLGTAPVLSAEQAEAAKKAAARAAEAEKRRREAEAKRKEEARQKALRTSAQSSCVAQFKRTAFCGCLVNGLDAAGLKEPAWNTLGQEFKAVVKLRDDYPTVPEILASCRKSSSE